MRTESGGGGIRVFGQTWKDLKYLWHVQFGPHRGWLRELTRELRAAQQLPRQPFHAHDAELLSGIRKETMRRNANNLTRTAAYLEFYREHPEVHWALLAHVVSRNGGWGMTDLRGEWFLRLAEAKQSQQFFAFLERANWLIFGDAYPQLLLYAVGKQRGEDCSRLLPALGVSKFMVPVWAKFFRSKDSRLLTTALIVNEQNYIEGRVVQNAVYREAVLATAQFQVQSLLDLNHVIIPYRKHGETVVAGTVVHNFSSLPDRIATGKRLYRTLFANPHVHRSIVDWMARVPHTGSRADYWPEVFAPDPSVMQLDRPYEKRWRDGLFPERPLYSAKLTDVWPDVHHPPAEHGDWFVHLADAVDLVAESDSASLDFTAAYLQGLRTTDQLVSTKNAADTLLK